MGCSQERGQVGFIRASEGLEFLAACSRWVRTVPAAQDGFLQLRKGS